MNTTLADGLREIGMAWVWAIVFLIVAVFGGFLTPWDAIAYLISDQGVGDGGVEILAFVAGYTLPLTVGFGVISFLVLTGINNSYEPLTQIVGVAVILIVAGFIASQLSLGLSPDYFGCRVSGPSYVSLPFLALCAYYNSYGLWLMICALAIGFAAAMQLERWIAGVGN